MCMCACECTCMRMCVCVSARACVCECMCMPVCVRVTAHVCVCECACACACECVCECACVRVHVCACPCARPHRGTERLCTAAPGGSASQRWLGLRQPRGPGACFLERGPPLLLAAREQATGVCCLLSRGRLGRKPGQKSLASVMQGDPHSGSCEACRPLSWSRQGSLLPPGLLLSQATPPSLWAPAP